MRRAAIALATVLLAATGAGGAQGAIDPVAACIRDNLVKYAPPDRAVVAQYLSLESACRAKVEGDEQAGVQTTPLGGTGGGQGTTGSGAGDPPSSTTTTTDPAAPVAPGAGTSGGPPTVTPSPLGRPAGATGPGARADVLAALADTDSADAVSPAGIGGGPGWLVALVAGLVSLVALAGVLGVRSRPR